MGAYGGIIGIEAEPFFGIEARVSLPAKFNVFSLRFPRGRAYNRLHYLTYFESKPDILRYFRLDYFDAYLGIETLASQRKAPDPIAEAGVFRYGDRASWTFFLNTINPAMPKPAVSDDILATIDELLDGQDGFAEPAQQPKPGAHWFEENDTSALATCHFKLLIDGMQNISFFINGHNRWGKARGRRIVGAPLKGFKVKACIGMDNRLGTVQFDRIVIDRLFVYADPGWKKKIPIKGRAIFSDPADNPPTGSAKDLARHRLLRRHQRADARGAAGGDEAEHPRRDEASAALAVARPKPAAGALAIAATLK